MTGEWENCQNGTDQTNSPQMPQQAPACKQPGERIMAAMSGGVDSAVAACLLKEAGYQVTGVTLKLYDKEWIGTDAESTCCSLEDVEDARQVCRRLGIDHFVYNFTGRFRQEVIDRFVAAYERGDTPNPCIDCNRYIKFEQLMQRAEELEFDAVATGHYARVHLNQTTGRYELKTALDHAKDQSYVLYSLTQQQLAHIRFPLGEMEKSQVRQVAQAHGFFNADKPDSQDICFVPDGDYAAFIRQFTHKNYPPGNFVNLDGKPCGKHNGMICYTLGQRKGLGLAFGSPVYVCGKNMEENQVVIGPESALYTDTLTADEVNLISVPDLKKPMRVLAKTRYRQKPAPAIAVQQQNGTLLVTFDSPQRAVTGGQAVVLYDAADGQTVVGGGTIRSAQNTLS